MSGVRQMTAADLDQVVSLYEFAARSGRREPAPRLKRTFERVFLEAPSPTRELASLVYESDGKITAFLGVHMRSFKLDGEPILMACSGPLVTEPDARVYAALLTRAFFAGPQRLSVTDGATADGCRLWMAMRGVRNDVSCVEWTRIFRPWRYASGFLAAHPRVRALWAPVHWVARPLLGLADALARAVTGTRFRSPQATLNAEPLTPATFCEGLSLVAKYARLAPDYDEPFATWLFEEMQRVESRGDWRAHLLRDKKGAIVGWYIYYLQPGGVSQAVQVAARPGHAETVLEHLFADADAGGSAALRGRVEPSFAPPLAGLKVILQSSPCLALIHSSDVAVYSILFARQALLTRLDGEWWYAFQQDPLGAARREDRRLRRG